MRLYIIRHAEPDYPNNTITPAGHLEAQALAKRMVQLWPDHVYSSPVPRARITADYSCNALGVEPTIEEWTAELSDCRVDLPPWGHITVWDVPGHLIRSRRPYPTHDDWHTHPHMDKPVFQEAFDRVKRNSDAFLARHGYVREDGSYRIARPNRDKVAVFCHGGFGLWWLAHLLELPLPMVFAAFHLPPSSVTTILFDERTADLATPRCIAMGDTSHLYAAGLPVSPSGIKANID